MPVHSVFDRSLPFRIKKYIEAHSFVDIDTMAEDLQRQYRNDYGRRKRNMFRKLVSQVHQEMLDSGELLQQQPQKKKSKLKLTRDGSSDISDDETKQYVEYENTNMMNISVSSMYNKSIDGSPQKFTPSRDPQQFEVAETGSKDEEEEKTASKMLGWYIDTGPNNKRTARPDVDNCNPTNTPRQEESNKTESRSEESIKQTPNHSITENVAVSNLHNGTGHLETRINAPHKKRSKSNDKSGGKRTKKRKTKPDKKDSSKSDEEDEFVPPGRKKFTLQEVDVTFSDIAGNHDSLQELARLLLHMSHPEIYHTLGVSPPRGVLLHGPPGCGKTLLGNAVAGQLRLPILRLVGPELIGGVSGESERRVRDIFETAIDNSPCVLFLDEIDAVAQRRDNSSKDMERRIVAQLLSCLDDLNKDSHQVMVVGATNRPDSLDPALRRAGRFDREICLGIPDENARRQILEVLCKKLKLAEDISFDLIARLTPGYVGADLLSLCREAAMRAVTRILDLSDAEKGTLPGSRDILEWLRDLEPFGEDKLADLSIETKDFELAVLDVQPSAKREGFATVPGVTWADIGALEYVREELSIAILGPVRNPAAFAALGLSRASGVLLAGPPGCGKTLLAKAIANESGINFVSVKGPELLNMYVGESERAVRQCFERARNSAPCVIFFDELDSLCPRRSSAEAGSTARVVNQMLTELDGLESRKQVFVVAATNRPDIIDPAVLRPGRLDKTLYVGIPSAEDRVKILETITKNGTKPPLSEDVCLRELALDGRCQGFSGADLSALVREAALNAIRGSIKHEWNVVLPQDQSSETVVDVTAQNFDDAFCKVSPSISERDRKMYDDMRKQLNRT